MKHFRFLTMAALIAFSSSVCAQTVITLDEMQKRKAQQQQQQTQKQTQAKQVQKEKTVSYSSASDYEGYGTLMLQFSPSKLKESGPHGSESENINSLSLGYIYSLPLGSMPLFLEFGGDIQWYFKSHEGAKTNMFSLKIPVGIMYSFDVSDAVSIQPYAGLYARANIIGKNSYDGKSYDIFSKDDMGGNAYKRFQAGWDAGLKFRFAQKFTVGAGYYMDFMPFWKSENGKHKMKIQGFDIFVGYSF